MSNRPIKHEDNAVGQLNAGISAATGTIVLGSGEGALFPTTYTGSATSGGTATALNSTSIGASGVSVGDIIENVTDGSYAVVLTVNTNDLVTTPLRGGSGNTWDNSDVWAVNRFVVTLIQYDTDGTTVLKREKVLIRSRSSDTLTVETLPSLARGYDGSSAQSFDASDYVYQFTVANSFDGLVEVLSDVITDLNDKLSRTNEENFAESSAGSDAYAITLSPAISSYTDGIVVSFRADVANTGNATLNVNSVGAYNILKQNDRTLEDGDIEAGQLVIVQWDATNSVWQMQSQAAQSVVNGFGGTGVDGALSISSGATNIDVGGANYYELNYTSISITGTGQLTFSNPASDGTIVVIKSQGDVTITSSTAPCIDLSGMGAAGGAGGTGTTGSRGASQAGSDGTTAIAIQDDSADHDGNGSGSNGTAAGTAGAILTNLYQYTRAAYQLAGKKIVIAPGSGGGGGGGAEGNPASNGGAGGNGGGGLILECKGSLNFTTALGISVAGEDGTDADDASGDTLNVAGGGGGGGGAAGFAVILYNSLTAASGTINSAGGAGGAGGDATIATGAGSGGNTQSTGGGGGGAGSYGGAGGAGAAGGASGNVTGTAGSAAAGGRAGGGGGEGGSRNYNSAGTSSGGAGGAGGSSENVLIAENTVFP